MKVPLDQIRTVVLEDEWRWRVKRIGIATGELTVSGLSRNDSKAFADVLELERSRDFFDRAEARPLTDDERRAVVIDESLNLVVAAARSRKTSVIAAKAGWLLHRGFQRPADLLLHWPSPEMPRWRWSSESAGVLVKKRAGISRLARSTVRGSAAPTRTHQGETQPRKRGSPIVLRR